MGAGLARASEEVEERGEGFSGVPLLESLEDAPGSGLERSCVGMPDSSLADSSATSCPARLGIRSMRWSFNRKPTRPRNPRRKMAANASLMKLVPRGALRLAMLRPDGIGAICAAEAGSCPRGPPKLSEAAPAACSGCVTGEDGAGDTSLPRSDEPCRLWNIPGIPPALPMGAMFGRAGAPGMKRD